MLRILHVLESIDPATGGPARSVTQLAAAQGSLGHRVGLLSGHRVPAVLPEIPSTSEGTAQPLQELRVGGSLSRLGLLTGWTAKRVGQAIAGWDVLHLHGVWDPLLYRVTAVARQMSVPYVIAPRGMLDPWSLAQRRWKKRLALALGFRKMLDRAAALHVLNEDEGRLIEPLGLRTPITILPNGVSLEPKMLPPVGSFRARQPGLGDSPYVLFLSRLHYKKGLDYLIDAFAAAARAHPKVQLVIAGPDGGAQAGAERAVQAAGLEERVHFVGPLYGTDKWAALADAACFCLPSRQEGFSMAILEALACGVPVVISKDCHFPEVAAAGAGLVVPLDAGKVAAALETILADADGRARMGRAGRELVQTHYTWPRIAADSIEMYRRLCLANRNQIEAVEEAGSGAR